MSGLDSTAFHGRLIGRYYNNSFKKYHTVLHVCADFYIFLKGCLCNSSGLLSVWFSFSVTSKTVFVYCSETTENLLMCNPEYVHLKEHIVSGSLRLRLRIGYWATCVNCISAPFYVYP